MSKISLLLLTLLALGLGFAVYLQTEAEQNYDPRRGEPLLGEGRVERVTSIYVDDVERHVQYELQRQDDGWSLVDPIDYPADPAMVRLFLEALSVPAEFVADADLPSLEPHFSPPRAVVLVTETLESGSTVEHELEIGSLDADGMRVEVRARGRILRILRNLDTAIARSIPDLRRRSLFTVRGVDVVSVQRLGANYLPDRAVDMTFEATRTAASWQLQRPIDMRLDPGVTGLWVIALSRLRASKFLSDIDDPNLSVYGLKDPALKVRLTDRRGKDEEVHFGQAPSGGWCARRAGDKHVVQVDPADLPRLLEVGRDLWDTRLLHAFRRDIEFVDLERGELGSLRLAQDESETWTVAERPLGSSEFGLPLPADVIQVERFLAVLEQNEIQGWLDRPEDDPKSLFPAGSERRGITLDLRGLLEGETQGGRFGEVRTTEAGTSMQVYLRSGDEVAGMVSVDVAEWLDRDLVGWRSLALWSLTEARLKQLRLTHGETKRVFNRQIQGTWRYPDVDATATELFDVLDSLVFLKASGHLASGPPMEDVVSVEFVSVEGDLNLARIGLVPEAEGSQVQVEILGLRSVAKDQDLHRRLLQVLEPR